MSSEEIPLPEQRRRQIQQLLDVHGQVLASELSQRFKVSEDTIRRDLRDMAKAGLLKRVHGGALPRAVDSGEQYHKRQTNQEAIKQALTQQAIGLIRNGQIVILDAGTTNLQLAKLLPQELSLTVITNCPPIAVALAEHPQVEVIMSGGKLQKALQALTGVSAVSTFQGINADLCFIGACAVDSEFGFCTGNEEEVHVKRAMLAASAETVAIATADKLGTVEPYRIASTEQLSFLVTERAVTEETLAPYVACGLSVLQG